MANDSENNKNVNDMHYGAEPFSYQNAEKLREYQTPAEAVLWEKLKNKNLDGIKFRRQHPVSRFVVDFYCHALKLVIELDGGIHENAAVKENDLNRQQELERFGLKVIRFSNNEIFLDIETVLNKIRDALNLPNNINGINPK